MKFLPVIALLLSFTAHAGDPNCAPKVRQALREAVSTPPAFSEEEKLLIQELGGGVSFLGYGPRYATARLETKIYSILEHRSSYPRGYERHGLNPELVATANLVPESIPEPYKTRWIRLARNQLRDESLTDPTMALVYAKLLEPLPENTKRELARPAARLLSAHLNASQLEGVYPPKVYQFAKRIVWRQMGIETAPLTDLIVVKNGGRRDIKIIALDEIQSPAGSAGEGHFGMRELEVALVDSPDRARSGSKLLNKEVEWQVGGKTYRAQIEAIAGPRIEEIAPSIRTLDYDSMWKDGALTGMIMPGQNMERFGRTVMNEYKSYYQEAGFRFGRPVKVNDFLGFMKSEVESGKLDYLLKEAHSEGDDRLLTNINKVGEILTGRRKISTRREEVIHLYYPSLVARTAVDFPYEDLALWLRKRGQNRSPAPLAYIDTSCFGLASACHLMTAAANPKLTVIGTSNQAETFTHHNETALLHLLEGIRNKANFAEIRQAMKKHVPSYIEGEDDVYRFPDEAEWRSSVRGDMSRSINIKIQVLDQDGKHYSIEDIDD